MISTIWTGNLRIDTMNYLELKRLHGESHASDLPIWSPHIPYISASRWRALLLTGLRLLKERGITFARLGTSGENIAIQKAAEFVGFRMEHKTIWFSRK